MLDDLGAAVNDEMSGLTPEVTATVNIMEEEPRAVPFEYVVSVAVAVPLVEFGNDSYHVVGIVNEVDEVLAATSTDTARAVECAMTSLYV